MSVTVILFCKGNNFLVEKQDMKIIFGKSRIFGTNFLQNEENKTNK
jgi:hypothetical protein